MKPHYRVAIFGSARIREGDKDYQDVFTIAKGISEAGFDIVTGGGPGLMQAANAGSKSVRNGGASIGLNIRIPTEQHSNSYLDIKQEFDRFSGRLDKFMALSDAVIVAPGGIGTLLELFYTWQLAQVEQICETPIILYGEMWGGLLDWLEKEVLSRMLFDRKDMHMIFHVLDPSHAVALVRKIQEGRETAEHVCSNFDRYKRELEKIKEQS